jgi:putative endopeptidase
MRFSKWWLAASLFIALSLGVAVVAKQMSGRGFDVANLDRTCKPCEDFNRFANGGWLASHPIPGAYSRFGRFEELADRNRETLHTILEADKATNAKRGTSEQKLGDFYASCMDEAKIEAEGTRPLASEFARIDAIGSLRNLQDEIAVFHKRGVGAVFGFGAAQDYKRSTDVIAQAVQAGLTLPDRDYYTKDDAKSKSLREEYVKHVAKMFELLGDDAGRSAAEAQSVLSTETKIAGISRTRVERRDPDKNYNKMTFAQLSELTPSFSWNDYLKARGIMAQNGAVNVGQPEFFKAIDAQLTATPLDDWKTYLRWHLIDSSAAALPKKFVDEDFNFKGRVLTGTTEQLPRWKRCVGATDRALGEALGQEYVRRTFTPEAKERAQTMVKNLVEALRDDLSTLSWMSDATRREATAKLNAFARKIGYPDTWRDYSALKIERTSYLDNILRANGFEINRNLGKIGKPVDRAEWGMTPPTVNAYYNPSMNEIVFPAGILQAPFFDPKADDAINYGGIGAVIGHEMTHGFDDQGSKFDRVGNLANWWTPADLQNFKQRTDCVVNQFSNFEVEPGLKENGQLVVGESVADLGGLTVAYKALQKAMQGKPRASIDGFTPEQRFFLGWAQVWAANIRPEAARLQVLTDPHPLGRFRVNGPLSNMPEFAKAFGCTQGEPMARIESARCQIW